MDSASIAHMQHSAKEERHRDASKSRGVLPHHRSVTVPAEPSTVISWPLVMRCVALPVPITAGMPYSRATIEPWARMPPMSVTSPRAWAKSGVQAGVVVGQTRIVPGSICPKSAGEWITLAGAVTRPG